MIEAAAMAVPEPPSLIEAIEARIGPAVLIDLSFPRAALMAAGGENPLLALLGPRDAQEQAFLLRFRQHGGHLGLPVVDPGNEAGAWPPIELAGANGSRRAVAFVSRLADAGQIAMMIREQGGAILLPAEQADDPPRAFEAIGFSTQLLAGDGQSFWLCVPRNGLDGPRRARRPEARFQEDRTFIAPLDERPVFPARLFVHDGGYPSEGDTTYSWLWTGPSAHFRLVVPRLGRRMPGRIEISIIRSEEPSNLDKLVVLLDGCPVPYFFDRWSDSSGKAVIDLPETDGYSIVSLVVPKMARDAHGDRLLGLCIDKLILLP